jgi:hypothetical protein
MAATRAGDAGRHHERLWGIAGRWATDGHEIADPPVPVTASIPTSFSPVDISWFTTSTCRLVTSPCARSRSSVSRIPQAMVSSPDRSTTPRAGRSLGDRR